MSTEVHGGRCSLDATVRLTKLKEYKSIVHSLEVTLIISDFLI